VDLDGAPVERVEQLRNQIALTKPGTKVELGFLRDGERKTATIEIGSRSSDDMASWSGSGQAHGLGLHVEDLTGELAEQLHFVGRQGVVVTDVAVGSSADRVGIRTGMLIEEVNRQPVTNVSDFRKALDAATGAKILLRVRDERAARFVVLER
jgi:serine protease Do